MSKCTVAGCLVALLGFGLVSRAAEPEAVRVVVEKAEILAEPNAQAKVLASAVRDDYLEVAERVDPRWFLVHIPKSTKLGFVESRNVRTVAAPGSTPPVALRAAQRVGGAGRPRTTSGRRWPEITVLLSATYAAQKISGTEASDFTLYQESSGKLAGDYTFKTAAGVDGSLRVYLKPWLALQGGYATTRRDGSLDVTASIPHPQLFDHNRSVQYSVTGLTLKESAFHFDLVLARQVGRMRIAAFGGPSFFTVEGDRIEGLVFQQKYPWESSDITVLSAPLQRLTDSPIGYNLGASMDVGLVGHLGLGLLVRYSPATVELTRPAPPPLPNVTSAVGDQETYPLLGSPLKLDAGGLQVGVGLRVRF